ncbi:MAG: M36 family metallopeptidase [Sandaracinaceae bacterium]
MRRCASSPGTLARLGLGVLAALAGPVAAPAHAGAQALAPENAYRDAAPQPGKIAATLPPGVHVLARDERRGVPTLLSGSEDARTPSRSPLPRAFTHLWSLAPLYGLSPAALGTVEVEVARRTASGGHLVILRQRVQGIPVEDLRLSLLMDANGGLVAAGGQLHGVVPTAPLAFAVDEAAAAAIALHADRASSAEAAMLAPAGPPREGGYRDFALTPAGRRAGVTLSEPIRSRRVLYALPTRLVPAYRLEVWSEDPAPTLTAYVVSALDGSLLERRSLTSSEVFGYRVFAEPSLAPYVSPFGDVTPEATGMPGARVPAPVPSVIRFVDGLNVSPMGLPDAWLEADAQVTSGNNVDAYADRVAPTGFSDGDLRAAVTSARTFDHAFDATLDAVADDRQVEAALTHLFYVNNWLHDLFYGVGFDEAAGNAQALNYGRGGFEGDALRAEGFDFGGRNNANMSTPSDGSSPRMQMYLWDVGRSVLVTPRGELPLGGSTFGPSSYDVSGPVAWVDDGIEPGDDGCEPIEADLSGRVGLVVAGACPTLTQVQHVEAAGALGAVVMDPTVWTPGSLLGDPEEPIGIPAGMIPQNVFGLEDGDEVRMVRTPRQGVPSSLDTQIIAHEWGHYLHRRLVAFSSRQGRAQSEGWADFIALLSLLQPSDDLDAPFSVASYAAQERVGSPLYFGIRRLPYSRNRDYNDLSFRHISRGEALPDQPRSSGPADNAQVHNAGEVWATMLFDATLGLVDRTVGPAPAYDFTEALRRMRSYVVTGMQLAPSQPTYTEQRDALILAALETDREDALRIARAFADRGAGTCAEGPERFSEDLRGVVEHHGLHPQVVVDAIALHAEGPGRRCDADVVVDSGEAGELRIELRNVGVVDLPVTTLEVTASDAALVVGGGSTVPVSAIASGEPRTLRVPVTVPEGAVVADAVDIQVIGRSGQEPCPDLVATARVVVDRDLGRLGSESFELPPPWLEEASLDGVTTGVWSVTRGTLGDPDRVLRAVDSASLTDTAVELPEVVGTVDEPLVLTFAHRFDLETSDGVLWDGGVLELSIDGGATWTDADAYVDPGYSGILSDRAGSALSLRPAWSGRNPSFPDEDEVRLDFGLAFAGSPVRFRFRLATDQAIGGPGWEIDDVALSGTEQPAFPAFLDDESDCTGAPVADAGPPRAVVSGEAAVLDGTGSRDPDGDPLSFAWSVLTPDTGIALVGDDGPLPAFEAPVVHEPQELRFRLRVSDGVGSDSSDTLVTVLPPPTAPDAGPLAGLDAGLDLGPGPDDAGATMIGADASPAPRRPEPAGCGCRVGIAERRFPGPTSALLLPLALMLVRRRRRAGQRVGSSFTAGRG